MTDVPVGCRCGGVSGRALDVSAKTGVHAICYCADCQAFARFLGSDGIVDAHGGSDIFQLAPASLVLSTGTKNIGCIRLSPKGMHRWFASCCRTPIGNTISAKVPFIGVVQPFMKHVETPRDEALGPPRAHFETASAIGGPPPGVKRVGVGAVLHFARFLLGGWVGGRSRPHALYDEEGRPVVVPEVLAPDVRAALARRA